MNHTTNDDHIKRLIELKIRIDNLAYWLSQQAATWQRQALEAERRRIEGTQR